MLDISIKELGKALKTRAAASAFVSKRFEAVEKIDGTKLTLIRNEAPFDPSDYTKNWIVSYKGSIIYPTEFSGLSKRGKEIAGGSLGTSQYKFVHDHLERVHPDAGEVPTNTEFFVEFVQNKPTITRDYEKKHGLYLVGYGPAEYLESEGRLWSSSNFVNDPEGVKRYAELLGLSQFPTVFKGSAASAEQFLEGCKDASLLSLAERDVSGIDFGDPSAIITGISGIFSKLVSSLGGQAEGVVIRVDEADGGGLYKVLAVDQHDKTVRSAKKSSLLGTPEEEEIYWREVNEYVDDVLDSIETGGAPREVLERISQEIYGDPRPPITHPKKGLINIQDDSFLTAKLRLLGTGSHRAKKVALIPMAAKPFHTGHDSLIQAAERDGNESIVLYVSVGGREELKSTDMMSVWKRHIIPGLRRVYGGKVITRFTSEPMKDATVDATTIAKRGESIVRLYGDPTDAESRVSAILQKNPALEGKIIAVGIDESTTGGVRGTKMRSYLTGGNKQAFVAGLPGWLSAREREEIWEDLSTKVSGVRSENLVREYIQSILAR